VAQKVLLIRFSAMGDCITTTWAATAIRNAWPDAEIVWAIEKQYADLVDVGRLVDRVHLFDGFRRGFRSRLAACLDLRRERFDFGVDFQGSTRTNLCLNLIAPRVKVSARKLKEGPAHEIGRSFELISPLGSFEIPDLPIMPRCADERLTIRKKSPRKRPLVTIQMGSSSPDRAYPAQLWSAVAAGLAEYGVTVVTIGGPGDPGIQCAGVKAACHEMPSSVRARASPFAVRVSRRSPRATFTLLRTPARGMWRQLTEYGR